VNPITRYRALHKAGVLGLNGRNCNYIMARNQRRLYPFVDNKIKCKQLLQQQAIAVPVLLDSIRGQYEASHLAERIIVVVAKRNNRWISAGGSAYSLDDIQFHVSGILNGMYSLGGQPDAAMIETLIRPAEILKPIAPFGVPDIRVIVYRGFPVMAMMRVPTRLSGGCANLHQGAIGVGINMRTGITQAAVMQSQVVDLHPDTGAAVNNFQIPDWQLLLKLAARCQQAIPLGYLGVDIVLDEQFGPQVLELNARPGLAIQIANQCGLKKRLDLIDALDRPEQLDLDQRLHQLDQINF
jgi:alpha-L-glutamate ligase-like protein